MELRVVQLCHLLEEFGDDIVKDIIADFFCQKNKDVEEFLKDKAITYEKHHKGRTFLVLGINQDKLIIVAYFTLAASLIKIDQASGTQRRRMLGTGFESNQQLSAILIGQLGKNDIYKSFISGKDLLGLALDRVLQANQLIGGRIVYLECEDKQILKDFYEDIGLILYVDKDGEPVISSTGLLTYLISTKNIMSKVYINEEIQERELVSA